MHKQIRIINASRSGQGSWEPGCYAAFALSPSLSASTMGTLGASRLRGAHWGWRDALSTQDSGTRAQWVRAGGWHKQDLTAVVQRVFLCGAGHAQTL